MDNERNEGEIPYYTTNASLLDRSELNDLIHSLTDANIIIPESVIAHYMAKSGCNITDPTVLKAISVHTQQYITKIISDAQSHRNFMSGGSGLSEYENDQRQGKNKKNKNKDNQQNLTNTEGAVTLDVDLGNSKLNDPLSTAIMMSDVSYVLGKRGTTITKPTYFNDQDVKNV